MPYPNYHSARVLNPKNIKGSCRMSDRQIKNKKVFMVFCQFPDLENPGNKKWLLQSVRFDKAIWTEEEVKEICGKEGWKFEPAKEGQRKYDLGDLPGKWVKKRTIIKSENGSSILIKNSKDAMSLTFKEKELY